MLMVPKIGLETRRPEEPSWTYSTLVASRLLCSEAGTGGACMLLASGFREEGQFAQSKRVIHSRHMYAPVWYLYQGNPSSLMPATDL